MTIADAPEPEEVLLPLWGFDTRKARPKLKEGTSVLTGEALIPGVYSTVTGTVKGIEPLSFMSLPVSAGGKGNGGVTAVRVKAAGTEEIDPALKPDPGYMDKEPADLLEMLNRANLGFCEDVAAIKSIDLAIVSAVDPDPMQWVYQQVLREEKETVLEGLKLIRHLTSARRVVLAVPEPLAGLVTPEPGSADRLTVHPVKPVYPNGLPEILVRDLSAVYHPATHLFLKIEKLVAAVKALKLGNPYSYKVVTLADKDSAANFRVRIGTPIKKVLELKSVYLKDDDKVIINGPMRGYTCFSTDVPVTAEIDSIYIQHADAGEVANYWNNQCMNCGACVKVCPVSLDVNLICRYSEFSLFERCHDMGVLICIECGLCAYYCPSGRSLVQYLRLAKKEKPIREEEKEEKIMEKE